MELKFYEKPCPICLGNGFLIQGENKVECYRIGPRDYVMSGKAVLNEGWLVQ